jgi:hypothetical protein
LFCHLVSLLLLLFLGVGGRVVEREALAVVVDLAVAGSDHLALHGLFLAESQNSSSTASLLLTTEALICDIPEKKDASQGGAPGGIGGTY